MFIIVCYDIRCYVISYYREGVCLLRLLRVQQVPDHAGGGTGLDARALVVGQGETQRGGQGLQPDGQHHSRVLVQPGGRHRGLRHRRWRLQILQASRNMKRQVDMIMITCNSGKQTYNLE